MTRQKVVIEGGLISYLALLILQTSLAQSKGKDSETLIVVSMDGLRWQYINEGFANTPNLDSIAREGVTSKFIKTVVPSKTWPNHHSFLTGLYPESHGIVSNKFFDPVYQEKFVLDYDCSNYDPKFYNASEPIWLTLQKNGGRSGVYFWPGFGGYPEKPTFYEKPAICPVNCGEINPKDLPNMRNSGSGWPPYIHCMVNHSEPVANRIDKIMRWLRTDLPPRLVLLYSEDPDSTGHGFSIESDQYRAAMERVDRDTVGYLINSLKNANMYDKVNIMFVSDHSMTDTSSKRQIFLENYINLDDFQLVEGGAVGHIWAEGKQVDDIYRNLTSANNAHMRVYKKEDIPEEYHWKHNLRIPPIFVDPDVGWVIKTERSKARQGNWTVGDHGWPSTRSKSYSVFFARGPAFRKGIEVSSFNTVDLYPLMCNLLGIEAKPNNGSFENIRLILKEYASKPTAKGVCYLCHSLAPLFLTVSSVMFCILMTD